MDTSRLGPRSLPIAILAAAFGAGVTLGCGGDGNGHTASPSLLSTPVASHCGGGDFCVDGNQCCGTQCIAPGVPCCQVPDGFTNAGGTFVCARHQECCGPGCIQAGSPCT